MNSTFLETNITQTGNPSFTFPNLYSHIMTQDCGFNNFPDFESSSFLDNLLVDYSPTNNRFNTPLTEITPIMQEINSTNSGSCASSFYVTPPNINHLKEKNQAGITNKEIKMNKRHVIAFRTKTQLEILDDGYKWRKYGKKKVKSNTNLRNYYKCSIGGCKIKKKVERDGHDSRYLITTYEGRHNHESNSSIIYNHEMSLNFLNEWTLQTTTHCSC